MKKVVYLLGAGAVQAEVDFQGIESGITMSAMSDSILEMSRRTSGRFYKLVQDFGLPKGQDVELMISLLENLIPSEENALEPIAQELRQLFREYLVSQITGKKVAPRLIATLLHLHMKYEESIGLEGERLLGILTTNYDSLTDDACSSIYGGLNCGCTIKSEDYLPKSSIPPLLKLHGSFNWRVTDGTIEVSRQFEKNPDGGQGGWIPPSVYKRPSATEVFGRIWSVARELLVGCDVLRVVGSALRNEDWSLISLIFTSQVRSSSPFEIELIVPYESAWGSDQGPGIIDRLRFLTRFRPMSELPKLDDIPKTDNPFYDWLNNAVRQIDLRTGTISEDRLIATMFYGGE